MSKTFISSIVVIVILLSSVAFLMWGYFTNRAAIEEQGEIIVEQGTIIEEQGIAIVEQGTKIANQEMVIAQQAIIIEEQRVTIEDMITCIESLEGASEELKVRVEALEAEWKRLEALGGYREFDSLWEVQLWLWNDPTSENQYIPTYYDCDDFAMDLTLAAIRDGRWIGLFATNEHLKNFTKIGNSIYEIEPQTDEASFWGYVD